jgi:hypothetical protein
MEFIVTSYKDRRKTPCEAEEASLRIYFELFASATGSARRSVETWLVYPFHLCRLQGIVAKWRRGVVWWLKVAKF